MEKILCLDSSPNDDTYTSFKSSTESDRLYQIKSKLLSYTPIQKQDDDPSSDNDLLNTASNLTLWAYLSSNLDAQDAKVFECKES